MGRLTEMNLVEPYNRMERIGNLKQIDTADRTRDPVHTRRVLDPPILMNPVPILVIEEVILHVTTITKTILS